MPTKQSKTSKTSTKTNKPAKPAQSVGKDAALATKLLAAKDPRKTLEKLCGKAADATVWRLLAAGLVPFRGKLADAAGCCAEEIDPAIVMRTLAHLDLEALREESVVWAFANSYRKDPDAWERALPTLPPPAHELLAIVRTQHGQAVDAAVVERVLDILAAAADDAKHTYSGALVHVVEPLSLSTPFHQRVLAHAARGDQPELGSDLVGALAVAQWETFEKIVRQHPLDRLEFYHFEDMLAKRTDSAQDLYDLFTSCGNEITGRRAIALLLRAYAQGTPVPPIEEVLADHLVHDWPRGADVMPALGALEPARRDRLVATVRASEERSIANAGLLQDAAFDAEIVEQLVDAVRDNEEWSGIESALTSVLREVYLAGAHGINLIDRAYAELADEPTFAGTYHASQVRLLFARVKFMASAGQTPRPLDLVMPGPDLCWVDRLGDAIGNSDPLEGLAEPEIRALFDAWHPLDWDDTLGMINEFPKAWLEAAPTPAIEDRPWDELVALVEQTAFTRLREGEQDAQTLTRLFGRPEPLTARIALAQQIGRRERAFTAANPGNQLGLSGMMYVLGAIAPHLIAARTPLPDDLAAIALDLLRLDVRDEIRDLLLALPRTQVDGWISTLCSDKAPKVKKRGKEYAKLVAAS